VLITPKRFINRLIYAFPIRLIYAFSDRGDCFDGVISEFSTAVWSRMRRILVLELNFLVEGGVRLRFVIGGMLAAYFHEDVF